MKKNNLLWLIIIMFSFWWFLIPGPRVAVDHPYWYKDTLDTFFSLPYIWRELLTNGLGESVLTSIYNWPVLLLHGLFSQLDFSFELLTFFTVASVLILSFISMQYLLSHLKIEDSAKFVGAFFYLTNTYFVLLIDGGQLNIAVAYALLPLVFVRFQKAREDKKVNSLFVFIFLATVISFFEIRILFLLFLLILVNLIFDLVIRNEAYFQVAIGYLKIGTFGFLLLIAVNSYWIVPAILGSTYLPHSYGRVEQLEALSFSSLLNGLFFMHPNWHQNVFGRVFPVRAEFILIPLLVFLAPYLYPKNRQVGFWLLVAIISIFFLKGANPPLGGIYTFFLENVPGFISFRDPSKFFIPLAISYSVLIAFTVNKMKFIFPVIIIYFLILIKPIFLGEMTGLFTPPVFKEEYDSITTVLKKDTMFSRVLWLPTRAPLGFSSPNHPSIEALYLLEKRPFALGAVGTYESLNFLREAPFMDEILDIAGIGYIAYPPLDQRREDPHPDVAAYYKKFLLELNSLSWLEVDKESRVPLLKNKNHQDRFFTTPNNWLIIGSDDIYNESTKSAKLSLKNNSLVFGEETPGLVKKIIDNPEVKIILNNKKEEDLSASLIDGNLLIFPANYLKFSPGKNGWWKRETTDFLWLKEFLKGKYGVRLNDFDYGGGWAIGEESLGLEIQDSLIRQDKLLLARVLESSKSGRLSFYQNNQLIGNIVTKKNGDNFKWVEVGILRKNKNLKIESTGGINIVNALSVIDRNIWETYQLKAKQLVDKGKIKTYGEGFVVGSVDIKYQVINPTKYKISLSGVSKPLMLAFSESYDSGWEVKGTTSLPLYSLINGFWIDKDGDYIVEYKPQKYVYLGLTISAVTIVFLLLVSRYNITAWIKYLSKRQ